ncbi:MAG: type VI secretion system baseplate subunit TssE [Candidatus Symbiodolus clandestinus]
MQSERLLERIRLSESGWQPSGSDEARFIASIARYLALMLNTQQGDAQTVQDFGMPDLNHVRFGEGLDDLRGLEQVIAERILKYEPRVQQVQVNFVPQEADPLSLMFRITLQLTYQQQVMPVVFETILDSDGRISILSG